jgi:hypothetical protein
MNETPSLLSETTSDVEHKPALGQVAIVLAGLALGIMLLGIQLWLLTIALDRYLAGQGMNLWVLVLISGLVFLGGVLMLRLLSRHPHFTPRPGG